MSKADSHTFETVANMQVKAVDYGTVDNDSLKIAEFKTQNKARSYFGQPFLAPRRSIVKPEPILYSIVLDYTLQSESALQTLLHEVRERLYWLPEASNPSLLFGGTNSVRRLKQPAFAGDVDSDGEWFDEDSNKGF